MIIPDLNLIKSNTIKYCNRLHLQKVYPEFYKYINENIQGSTLAEKLYIYFYGTHVCPICGKKTKFMSFNRGYYKYCSNKCARNDTEVENKRKQTCLEKYGTESPAQNKDILSKMKQTCLKKYGVDNILKKKEYIKECTKKKYGVDNIFKKKEYIKECIGKKYGGVGAASNIIKNKMKQTCLKKYGVENTFQSDIIKEKIKHTNLKKLGVEYPTQSQTIRDKVKQTNLERYGVEYSAQNIHVREKQINSLRKNNMDNKDYLIEYTDDGEWVCKCPHPNTCTQCHEKFYIIKPGIYHDRFRLNNELCTKLFPIGSMERGVSNSSQIYFDQLNHYFPDSIYYKKSGYEYKIGKYSLDCYIPSKQSCIEYNGVYWHAKPTLYKPDDILNIYGIHKTAQEIWDHDKIRKEYIKLQGIKVIVVWEDELPSIDELRELISD